MTVILDERRIKDVVRNYIDPLLTKLQERIYGSGNSYNTTVAKTVLPPDTVYDADVEGIVTAAGFIKGISTYLSGVLKGTTQTQLDFVNMLVTVSGPRTTITAIAVSGQPRIIAGWYFGSPLQVGSGTNDFGPVYQIDAPVMISGLWGNSNVTATATNTFDVAWSTDLVSWQSIYSVKPTITSGNRVNTRGTLSKTTLETDDFVRFGVVSIGGTTLSGVTMQLRTISR